MLCSVKSNDSSEDMRNMQNSADAVTTRQLSLNKKIISRSVILLASIGLLACDSSSNSESSSVVLDINTREILSVNANTLQVDIRVNGGQSQTFSVDPSQNEPSVTVFGVRVGESNNIEIRWSELLNGYQVELSLQSQTFFADSNNAIDAPHSSSQFDYDEDGVSNLDERHAGTCVWSANELCLETGQTDSPSAIQAQIFDDNPSPLDLNNATVVVDSDFSSGLGLWEALVETRPTTLNGEFCATFSPMDIEVWLFLASYNPVLDIAPASYAIQFDVRASRNAAVEVGLYHPPTSTAVFDSRFEVTEGWETNTVSFVHEGDALSGVTLGLNALTSNIETTFCFDNIKFVQLN